MRCFGGLAVFCVTAIAACAGTEGESGEVPYAARRDSAGVEIVVISGDPSALPGVALSATHATEIRGDVSPFLSDAGEVALRADGAVLVEDNRSTEIYAFDSNGEPLARMGGAGDGPGEFRNITALSMGPADRVYVYDRRLGRISVLAGAGDLVRMVTVARDFAGRGTIALDAWPLSSGEYLLHSMGAIESDVVREGARLEQRTAVVQVLDSLGAPRGDPVRFPGGLATVGQQFDGSSPFGNATIVAVGHDQVVTGAGVDYDIRVLTRTLQTRRIIRWPGWERPLEEAVLLAARDSLRARFEATGRASAERVTTLLDALFAPELVPASLPVLGKVLIDHAGRLWVSRYSPATEVWAQETAWHVLDPTGQPLAQLSLPARTRLVAVGDDRIALVTRDDLDVQHVRVFDVVFGDVAPAGN